MKLGKYTKCFITALSKNQLHPCFCGYFADYFVYKRKPIYVKYNDGSWKMKRDANDKVVWETQKMFLCKYHAQPYLQQLKFYCGKCQFQCNSEQLLAWHIQKSHAD